MKAKSIPRNAGMFLLHTLIAVLGAAVVESPLHRIIHARTGPDVVLHAIGFSVLLPAVIAYFMFDGLRSSTAKWVWVLPSLLFAFGVLVFSGTHTSSILGESMWARFSGHTCGVTLQRGPCQYFFIFTIPFVRSISYSTGASIRAATQNAGPEPADVPTGAVSISSPEKSDA